MTATVPRMKAPTPRRSANVLVLRMNLAAVDQKEIAAAELAPGPKSATAAVAASRAGRLGMRGTDFNSRFAATGVREGYSLTDGSSGSPARR